MKTNHVPIFAIIIGVSQYQSSILNPLPAARSDALHLARSLVGWGIPESQIFLMCSYFETQETLKRHLQEIMMLKVPFQLLFYFCGHGFRTNGPHPKSYLIFSDSEVSEDGCMNAVDLEELLSILNQLNTTNLYLFIDACYLRLNSIMNPKLKEEIQGKKDSQKNLFCLLSSGIFTSYEDAEHNYGYFTEAFIKALAQIRQSDRSPITLFRSIQGELQKNGLPEPEMYNIGTCHIDFLSSLFPYVENGKLVRQHVIAELQDLLVTHRQKALCLTGPDGSGKTTLALQLSSERLQRYLIPLRSSHSHLRDKLLHSLLDCLFFQACPSVISLEDCLDYLEVEIPDIVLIFDEIQENELRSLKEVLNLFIERSIKVIFIANQSHSIYVDEELRDCLVEYLIPPLTYEETRLLVRESFPENFEEMVELYHLVSKGNPQKLNQALNHLIDHQLDQNELNEVKKAIAAVYSCGLFINQELFIKTFNLGIKTFAFLEKIGLIHYEEACWRPHSFLLKIAESEEVELDRASTLTYWSSQFDELPYHFISASNLVLTVKCFGYEPRLDPQLKSAFQVLYNQKSQGLNVLKEGASIFVSLSKITPSSLFLAEILLELEEFDLAQKLLNSRAFSSKLDQQSHITYSHLLWRIGLFSECIRETTFLLNKFPIFAEKIWCYLHRGASHFFLGNWQDAKIDFSRIIENAKPSRHVGWARCLLGTITGIRGIEFEESKNMIESGIRMLLKNDDLIGAWIGWNNLGEMMWKAGELRASAYYLQKALEMAEGASHTSAILETLRNFLQLEFRTSQPSRSKMRDLLAKIEEKLKISNEIFELMQLYNTLSTIYFYLRDYARSRNYLKKAIPLTTQSKEYHIYTLTNLAFHFKVSRMESKAISYLQRARSLATSGHNFFALSQIDSDYALLFSDLSP